MIRLLRCLLFISFFVSALPGHIVAQQIVQLGTDPTYDNIYSPVSMSPFGKNIHFQQLYTASELNSLGITSASFVDSLAINVYQAPEFALPGYAIKMKNTNAASITTFDGIALTQVYSGTFAPAAGQWNWMHFQTPFFWDGTSNLIIDFCFDTTATSPTINSGKVYYTESITGGTVVFKSVTSQCSDYSNPEPFYNRTNIKLSMRLAPACTGTPATPYLTPTGPFNICPSYPVTLNAISTSTGNGLAYSWQKSTDNGASWQTIASVTGNIATFAVGDTTQFRAQLTCSSSGQTASSLPVQINPNTLGLIYRPLPYAQDFEQWQSRCANLELPDSNWTASPATGDLSWRREDQGDSASWTGSVTPVYYMPVSSNGSHSARFHTGASSSSGDLSVFVDCTGIGPKELRFDYMNKTYAGSAANMEILVSTDAGSSFTQLAVLNSMGVNAEWQHQTLPFTSTTPNTIIKFVGHGEQQWGDFDMGIDNLHILPACVGAPVAGTVDSNSACLGSGVQLSLSGATAAGGMTWLWQQSTNGVAWDNVIGGDQEISTTTLNQNTWFRCIVGCSVSGLSDTSAPRLLFLTPFYNCYCNSSSTAASAWVNIGNVQLLNESGSDTLINNGNPLPSTNNIDAKKHYSDYATLGIANISRDSSYHLNLTFMTSFGPWSSPVMSGSYTKAYIDYNHNSIFDTYELIWEGSKADEIFETTGMFTVPDSALIGITRMRIVTNTDGYYDSTVVEPCGPYYGGETEDYLVKINYAPCTGAIDAGGIVASDTAFCPGYSFTINNVGYDSLSGFVRYIWQSSTDNILWNDISGTADQHVLHAEFTTPTWFRVKATCEATTTETYSNIVKLETNEICYCVSYADGGFSGMADSSDIGGFKLETVNHPLVGSHLNNALAINSHSDFLSQGIISFFADSVYTFTLDHILLRNTHADAKLTLFIDFNCNGTYDVPSERVYTGITTATTWHKTGTIVIPANAILNTTSGMRLIINNDTAANIPSDEACGTYTSGETEDYLVSFTSKTTGISGINQVSGQVVLFPNPSKGIVILTYQGELLQNVTVLVQDMAGQTLLKKEEQVLKNDQALSLDLSKFAKGIYFIRLITENISQTTKVVLQ